MQQHGTKRSISPVSRRSSSTAARGCTAVVIILLFPLDRVLSFEAHACVCNTIVSHNSYLTVGTVQDRCDVHRCDAYYRRTFGVRSGLCLHVDARHSYPRNSTST